MEWMDSKTDHYFHGWLLVGLLLPHASIGIQFSGHRLQLVVIMIVTLVIIMVVIMVRL